MRRKTNILNSDDRKFSDDRKEEKRFQMTEKKKNENSDRKEEK